MIFECKDVTLGYENKVVANRPRRLSLCCW